MDAAHTHTHTRIFHKWLTSCKMLRNCNSCCLQYWTSWIIEFRSVLSNMNSWSSGEPLAESRCDDGRVDVLQLVRLRFSMDRVPSSVAWWKRDRFSRRVDWTGSWDLCASDSGTKWKTGESWENRWNNSRTEMTNNLKDSRRAAASLERIRTDRMGLMKPIRAPVIYFIRCIHSICFACTLIDIRYMYRNPCTLQLLKSSIDERSHTYLFDRSNLRTRNVSHGLKSVFIRRALIVDTQFIIGCNCCDGVDDANKFTMRTERFNTWMANVL